MKTDKEAIVEEEKEAEATEEKKDEEKVMSLPFSSPAPIYLDHHHQEKSDEGNVIHMKSSQPSPPQPSPGW